ncbi:MAG: rod shape-determining protein MreC [Gaiellaceae bacterium]
MAGSLVLLSIVLITIYFREPVGGGLHGVQSAGATVLRPFEVGADRVARPFRDAYGWFSGVLHAKSENGRLRREVDSYRTLAIRNANAAQQNAQLKQLLHYVSSPQLKDFDPVPTDVTSRSPSEFEQQIGIAASSSSGIRVNDPVVNADGLVGLVTNVAHSSAEVTLLTDAKLKVSALDLHTRATGLVGSGQSPGSLIVDRVSKSQAVYPGDLIETQGWHVGKLASNYPPGIPIGTVSSASVNDVSLYWQVQLKPQVDFGSSLQSVIVLVPKTRRH